MKKEDENTKVVDESSNDSLKGLLDMQLQFETVLSTQLLQLPMQQGQVDMGKISPCRSFKLVMYFMLLQERK